MYATERLPHDAQAKSLGTGRSIEEIARSAGWRVGIVPKLSVADGINAVRALFPTMWFDKERCADGVQALRHYRYDVDPDGPVNRRDREPFTERDDSRDTRARWARYS